MTIRARDVRITINGEPAPLTIGFSPLTELAGRASEMRAQITCTMRSSLRLPVQTAPTTERASVFRYLSAGLDARQRRWLRRAMGLTVNMGPVRARRSRQNRAHRERSKVRSEGRRA